MIVQDSRETKILNAIQVLWSEAYSVQRTDELGIALQNIKRLLGIPKTLEERVTAIENVLTDKAWLRS